MGSVLQPIFNSLRKWSWGKKLAVAALFGCLVICLAGVLVIRGWTHTEHGKLDLSAAIFIRIFDAAVPKFNEVPLEEYRAAMDTIPPCIPPEVAKVEDMAVPGKAGDIPIRVYWPEESMNLPITVFYHGGGFVVGNIDTYDNMARLLAKKSSTMVVSVGYRLAPESTFPAAVEDAYAALEWISGNAGRIGGNPDRIAVAGDSAGGNLAAVISLMARDQERPDIDYQVLIYPATDLSRTETESYRNFSKGFFLTKEEMEWFRSLYLPDEEDWRNPYASPLLAEDHGNLPPALVITAQFDPLRDEGEAYAELLREDGVPVKSIRYEGTIDGFLTLDVNLDVQMGKYLKVSTGALDVIAGELRSALYPRNTPEG